MISFGRNYIYRPQHYRKNGLRWRTLDISFAINLSIPYLFWIPPMEHIHWVMEAYGLWEPPPPVDEDEYDPIPF